MKHLTLTISECHQRLCYSVFYVTNGSSVESQICGQGLNKHNTFPNIVCGCHVLVRFSLLSWLHACFIYTVCFVQVT